MGETELIVLATLSTCAALLIVVACCVKSCLNRQPSSVFTDTDEIISEQPNSLMDQQKLVPTAQEGKTMAASQQKELIDYM